MKVFTLSYDQATSFALREELTAFVRSNRHVLQWAQPFGGCFILKSDAPQPDITASFAEFFAGKTPHIITPITPAEASGILPMNIWGWMDSSHLSALNGVLGLIPPAPRP